jgi:hypothetical protein
VCTYMYLLEFRRNNSKYFPEALQFAKELGGTLEGNVVRIAISDVLNAYSHIRTLFAIIQNWKGTLATYNGVPVHPYQFLLSANYVKTCKEEREIDNDCGPAWSCRKVDNLVYNITGAPFKTKKYWYNFGSYRGYKWLIDKQAIYKSLRSYASSKALDACPFFSEEKLKLSVKHLPDYLVPDNQTFKIVYKEKYIDGQIIKVPDNIEHLVERPRVLAIE